MNKIDLSFLNKSFVQGQTIFSSDTDAVASGAAAGTASFVFTTVFTMVASVAAASAAAPAATASASEEKLLTLNK